MENGFIVLLLTAFNPFLEESTNCPTKTSNTTWRSNTRLSFNNYHADFFFSFEFSLQIVKLVRKNGLRIERSKDIMLYRASIMHCHFLIHLQIFSRFWNHFFGRHVSSNLMPFSQTPMNLQKKCQIDFWERFIERKSELLSVIWSFSTTLLVSFTKTLDTYSTHHVVHETTPGHCTASLCR